MRKFTDFGLKCCWFFALVAILLWPIKAIADCSLTSLGILPLNDQTATYKSETGGLYPDASNTRPASHDMSGANIASNEVLPRNGDGAVDLANGKIVMISVGMSNTTQEFATKGPGAFKVQADADPAKNPQLVIVDGAQGGQPSSAWTSPTANTWDNVDTRLANAGVTPLQVQVAWIKQARPKPAALGAFPLHAQILSQDLADITRSLKIRYPNVKLAYFSSRTRAYTDVTNSLNPEPYAFESAFSVRWLLQDQINGTGNLNFNPAAGTVVAPWLAWGPYLWTDGTVPRSDGFTWLCSNLESDFTHPSASGVTKVGDQLLVFFKTDTTATPWFLRSTVSGAPPDVTITADRTNGPVPLTIHFSTTASDADGTVTQYLWNFGDGGFSRSMNAEKVFHIPGTYAVRATATDDAGNAVTHNLTITASAPSDVRGWQIYDLD